jgi:hypothetical protein
LPVTTALADRLVRLPLWVGLEDQIEAVIGGVYDALKPASSMRRGYRLQEGTHF